MQNEEERIDLIDYTFLDDQFYESFLTLGDVIKDKNTCMLIRDASLARSKNSLFFEVGSDELDIKILKKVDFFFQ